MFSRWTVGRQFLVGLFLLALMIGTFVYLTRMRVQAFSGAAMLVSTSQKTLRQLERIHSKFKDAESAHRDYLLAGGEAAALSFQQARAAVDTELQAFTPSSDPEHQKRITALQEIVAQELKRMDESLEARRVQGSLDSPSASNAQSRQRQERVREAVGKARESEEAVLGKNELQQEEELKAFGTFFWIDGLGIMLVITTTALLIGRALERKLQTAISQVQNSSAELHSAATQQVTGAREQASATTEISTTVKELLSTSRQIATSAQQVSRVADETAGAARQGNDTVQRSQEAIDAVRRQVDSVVTHMLELGKRSQEIGGILDIINELSEQTNILAINATIESAGAGEHGRRFAVVAEEIRKLADRVGGATKDIRALIDEIRAASNTTIMATEDGSKAVQSSAKQFSEVAGSFRRISELVRTNLDVVREIELSTQQQTTAVEQVNIAILEVAQTAQQSEVSSSQTLQTANRLSQLSQQLTAILDARTSA
ncbi:HAMP domain-containing methyl-accepting chemotaxis protein [Melittangium boletus]|uniref:HAMP domain-containing methyl-accepting chemotaxis protein n=1 Tax=Melittangium boletus TaxID=83453 RepID=UPI003DA5BED3